jgi:hypothetical protein
MQLFRLTNNHVFVTDFTSYLLMLSLLYRYALLASLAALSLFASACNRDSVPTMEQQLVGRWEWQQTSGSTNSVLTPASTGHQLTVVFDRRGRARFYQDGNLLSAAAFTVRHKRGGFRRPGRYIIQYRGYEGTQYYSVTGNILYLEETRGKAIRHSYVRLPSETELTTLNQPPK